MVDDTRERSFKREELPPGPRRAIEEPALSETLPAALRARVRKFALPGVLALAVATSTTFGALAWSGGEEQSLTAAPAPEVLPERTAVDVTRSAARPAEVTPAAEAQQPEATDMPPQQALPAAQAMVLTGFRPAPAPSSAAPKAVTPKAVTPKAAAPKVSGRMFATKAVNVRAEATISSSKIGLVQRGKSVMVTDRTRDGFTQVVRNGKTGWVSSQFLSHTAPAPAKRSVASANSSAPREVAAPTGSARVSSSEAAAPRQQAPVVAAAAAAPARVCTALPGLQSNTAALHQALCANFPAIGSFGGVRADWDVEHPSGRALDAMTTDQATGDAVANWARDNASRFGITEVIWNQRIWTTQRAGEGWRTMANRGSATANHQDHVHISVR